MLSRKSKKKNYTCVAEAKIIPTFTRKTRETSKISPHKSPIGEAKKASTKIFDSSTEKKEISTEVEEVAFYRTTEQYSFDGSKTLDLTSEKQQVQVKGNSILHMYKSKRKSCKENEEPELNKESHPYVKKLKRTDKEILEEDHLKTSPRKNKAELNPNTVTISDEDTTKNQTELENEKRLTRSGLKSGKQKLSAPATKRKRQAEAKDELISLNKVDEVNPLKNVSPARKIQSAKNKEVMTQEAANCNNEKASQLDIQVKRAIDPQELYDKDSRVEIKAIDSDKNLVAFNKGQNNIGVDTDIKQTDEVFCTPSQDNKHVGINNITEISSENTNQAVVQPVISNDIIIRELNIVLTDFKTLNNSKSAPEEQSLHSSVCEKNESLNSKIVIHNENENNVTNLVKCGIEVEDFSASFKNCNKKTNDSFIGESAKTSTEKGIELYNKASDTSCSQNRKVIREFISSSTNKESTIQHKKVDDVPETETLVFNDGNKDICLNRGNLTSSNVIENESHSKKNETTHHEEIKDTSADIFISDQCKSIESEMVSTNKTMEKQEIEITHTNNKLEEICDLAKDSINDENCGFHKESAKSSVMDNKNIKEKTSYAESVAANPCEAWESIFGTKLEFKEINDYDNEDKGLTYSNPIFKKGDPLSHSLISNSNATQSVVDKFENLSSSTSQTLKNENQTVPEVTTISYTTVGTKTCENKTDAGTQLVEHTQNTNNFAFKDTTSHTLKIKEFMEIDETGDEYINHSEKKSKTEEYFKSAANYVTDANELTQLSSGETKVLESNDNGSLKKIDGKNCPEMEQSSCSKESSSEQSKGLRLKECKNNHEGNKMVDLVHDIQEYDAPFLNAFSEITENYLNNLETIKDDTNTSILNEKRNTPNKNNYSASDETEFDYDCAEESQNKKKSLLNPFTNREFTIPFMSAYEYDQGHKDLDTTVSLCEINNYDSMKSCSPESSSTFQLKKLNSELSDLVADDKILNKVMQETEESKSKITAEENLMNKHEKEFRTFEVQEFEKITDATMKSNGNSVGRINGNNFFGEDLNLESINFGEKADGEKDEGVIPTGVFKALNELFQFNEKKGELTIKSIHSLSTLDRICVEESNKGIPVTEMKDALTETRKHVANNKEGANAIHEVENNQNLYKTGEDQPSNITSVSDDESSELLAARNHQIEQNQDSMNEVKETGINNRRRSETTENPTCLETTDIYKNEKVISPVVEERPDSFSEIEDCPEMDDDFNLTASQLSQLDAEVLMQTNSELEGKRSVGMQTYLCGSIQTGYTGLGNNAIEAIFNHLKTISDSIEEIKCKLNLSQM